MKPFPYSCKRLKGIPRERRTNAFCLHSAALPAQAEFLRIEEEKHYKAQNGLWRKWGPYLSERQWGTVREDYSPDGNAWAYFTNMS